MRFIATNIFNIVYQITWYKYSNKYNIYDEEWNKKFSAHYNGYFMNGKEVYQFLTN